MKKNPARIRTPRAIESAVLVKCRRRCAFCYAFETKNSEPTPAGQLAHINRDRSDNREENLAYLCLRHHDQYDGKTSQSKGLTERELKTYKGRLEEVEARRGKFNHEDATIRIEGDISGNDMDAEAFLQSIRALVQLKRPVIFKSRTGSQSFTVTMANEDLGTLMEATDKGLLSPIRITSVTPSLSLTERDYKFYQEFPVFETFDKKDTVRIFESSQYYQDISCNRWVVRFSSYQCPNNDSIVALTIATISGQKIEIGEPLVIARDEVCNWRPDNPIELLKSFLTENGQNITFRNTKPVKLILNEEFTSLGQLGEWSRTDHHELVLRIFRVSNSENSVLRYHDVNHGHRCRMLFLFAVSREVVRKMECVAKSMSWF